MKTNLMRAALACAALAFASTAVMASTTPVPGVDVVVHCHCFGKPMMYTTSEDGTITVRDLAPGEYEIEIVGKSLIAAMDKLAPPVPEKKSEGSSFSLGVGGMFGGGSSHSSSGHEGAGPVGGGHDTHGSSHSSGGGVGVGMNIPIGGGDSPPERRESGGIETVVVTAQFDLAGTWAVTEGVPVDPKTHHSANWVYDWNIGHDRFSVETPHRRDAAGLTMDIKDSLFPGMRIGFTILDRARTANIADQASSEGRAAKLGTLKLTIFDRWPD
jgi:hypothetical protein